jgi:excisionase family DNA binding protein
MEEPNLLSPTLVIGYISVKDAAYLSGYNIQYLRRMLRFGVLDGVKIGQMWLIELDALEKYLNQAENTSDRRRGPR